jgi:hypothetical protein
MFSLIIVLISIVLVVALALATIYYGGKTANWAAIRNSASTVVNQAAQIAAAGVIADSQGAGWPSASPNFPQPFLKGMPVPPRSAYADPVEIPAVAHWTYYLDPAGSTHHFVLKNKISRDVCMAINREQGFIGIPAVWDGSTLIQCFGPGVAARDGAPLGYTFFYDPVGTTPSQKTAALDKSKAEGGSTTAGYPRSCPDGTNIESGLCPDSGWLGSPIGSGGSSGPSGPQAYGLVSVPGVMTIEGLDGTGSNYSSYCSAEMPMALVTEGATLTVGGLPASVDYIYQYGGSTCVDSYGNPPHAAGSVPVVLTTTEGSTATGSVTYVEALAPAPVITDMSPRSGAANVATRVTITGENFAPGIKVYLEYAKDLPVTYVSSTQIEVTIPVSTTVGYPADWNATATILFVNPDSDSSYDLFDYVGVNDPGNGGGGGGTGAPGGGGTPSGWTFVPGMTTQVLVSGVGPANFDEMGVQQSYFATYRAVENCTDFWPTVGDTTDGEAFCIPALKAEYLEWEGHTAGYVSSQDGNYHQFGFVLSDGTNTYTFLKHYNAAGPYPGLTMYSGVVSGPLGTPPSVPWTPDYGCGGYCNQPRND